MFLPGVLENSLFEGDTKYDGRKEVFVVLFRFCHRKLLMGVIFSVHV